MYMYTYICIDIGVRKMNVNSTCIHKNLHTYIRGPNEHTNSARAGGIVVNQIMNKTRLVSKTFHIRMTL